MITNKTYFMLVHINNGTLWDSTHLKTNNINTNLVEKVMIPIYDGYRYYFKIK